MLAGTLIAILQALTMFGSPAILALPAGFHVITTKIWSLFQYPPKPGLAAAAALPLLIITVLLLWGQARILGRRGYTVLGGKSGDPRILRLGRWSWLAWTYVGIVLCLTVIFPYLALIKTAFTRTLAEPFTLQTLTLHHFNFVFFEFSATQLAMRNTLVIGVLTATIGTAIALVISYLVSRRSVPGSPVLGYLATAPVAIPGIVLGVGLFLAYSHPSLMLYGTLWILLDRLPDHRDAGRLPAALLRLQEHPSRARGGEPHPRRDAHEGAAPDHGAAPAHQRRRDLVLHLHRHDPRTLGHDPAHHRRDQARVGHHLRPATRAATSARISVLGIMLLVVSFTVVVLANRLPVLGGQRMPALR